MPGLTGENGSELINRRKALFLSRRGKVLERVRNYSGMIPEPVKNQSRSILSERKGREGKGREGGREEKVSRESVKNDSGMNLDGMILDAPATARPSLIQTFERDFGRPLSPTEYEQVQKWQENHPPDVVREALRRAVLNGKFNFRYFDAGGSGNAPAGAAEALLLDGV